VVRASISGKSAGGVPDSIGCTLLAPRQGQVLQESGAGSLGRRRTRSNHMHPGCLHVWAGEEGCGRGAAFSSGGQIQCQGEAEVGGSPVSGMAHACRKRNEVQGQNRG